MWGPFIETVGHLEDPVSTIDCIVHLSTYSSVLMEFSRCSSPYIKAIHLIVWRIAKLRAFSQRNLTLLLP